MEELSFEELRKQYYKKEKKRLSLDNQSLMKRLKGFQTVERNGDYSIMTQDKEQECEEIIEILRLQKKALRKESMEKV